MKQPILTILLLCLLVCTVSCQSPVYEEPVGGDWHVWGIYDFVTVDGIGIAVQPITDEGGLFVGYDLYLDGTSLGAGVGVIRCSDGGFQPGEMDREAFLLFEDYNGDGLTDIGAPLTSGDVLRYLQVQDEVCGTEFIYYEANETEKGETK